MCIELGLEIDGACWTKILPLRGTRDDRLSDVGSRTCASAISYGRGSWSADVDVKDDEVREYEPRTGYNTTIGDLRSKQEGSARTGARVRVRKLGDCITYPQRRRRKERKEKKIIAHARRIL